LVPFATERTVRQAGPRAGAFALVAALAAVDSKPAASIPPAPRTTDFLAKLRFMLTLLSVAS
jgi:hypothetical protein